MITKRKSRYVLVEPSSTGTARLFSGFESEMLRVLGQVEYTKAAPKVVAQHGSMFVVRVNRGFERGLVLASAFARVDGIGFRTLKTSGTLRTLADYAKAAATVPGNKG
jgi:RNase P/RNase MRP subunit POP5